jgi:hypothetical protein
MKEGQRIDISVAVNKDSDRTDVFIRDGAWPAIAAYFRETRCAEHFHPVLSYFI